MEKSPEIGQEIITKSHKNNLHDLGTGDVIIFIHGSGPGVSAWANWRLVIPELKGEYRIIAPDMAGFGFTERKENEVYSRENWTNQIIEIMDALNVKKAHFVGNSFGGAMALAMAINHPERVGKMVLMGSVGVSFPITNGLDDVWGYEPSIENMRKLLDIFAYDRSIVNDELARLRYEASIRPGFQESFSKMFPAPRQRWVDALAFDEAQIKNIPHETMIIHGRDDLVIPLENSLRLNQLIDNSQLHIFGRCGHWTQIEKNKEFCEILRDFFV
jgi:2-hydroxymuconate-semialdehyde hydrolase